MADWTTISSLATAGGTLVLAIATFSSTRSSTRSARVSERALQAGLRPVLMSARVQDPPQKIGYADGHWLRVSDGMATVQDLDGNLYLAMPLRNVASGIGVLHGWRLTPERVLGPGEHPPPEEFRVLGRDLYVPAGDTGFWQAALRDPEDDLHEPVRRCIDERTPMTVDLLYGDHEGGQRTISRFSIAPRGAEGRGDLDASQWTCAVARHWNLDRQDPR